MSSTNPSIRSTAHKFLNAHRAATLATVNPKKQPDAASVFYIVDEELTIYFMTRVESRKFHNIEKQTIVSMVITDEDTMETIQLTGAAERVENLEEENEALTKLWTADYRNPNWPGPAVKLFESGHSTQIAVVKVVPREMTYAVFKKRDKGKYGSFFEEVI
jgi:general stress protein 26